MTVPSRHRTMSSTYDQGKLSTSVDGEIDNHPKKDTADSKQSQHRKRKKQYFNAIRQQMEFYFSDANLTKDRFLKKQIATDPYVPLSVFMKFNKIKEMVRSINDIQKSLDGSKILELSGDKQRVRRTTAVKAKDDVDECTIYVEALPPNATHETVRNQFKQFGNVTYVSLPKYRTSGRIKEFAFVEFEQKSSVERCISAFQQFDGVIDDRSDPEKLKSVETYVKEQDEYERMEPTKKPSQTELPTSKNDTNRDTSTNEPDPESATDYSDTESLESQPPPAKRPKLKSIDDLSLNAQKSTDEKCDGDENESNDNHNDDVIGDFDDDDEEDGQNDAETDEQNVKRKRSRRKRRKPKANQPLEMRPCGLEHGHFPALQNVLDDHPWQADGPTNSINALRIASKTEWKRLRNKYLTLQREKYAEAKQLLQQQHKKEANSETQKKVSTLPPVRPVVIKTKQYATQPPSAKRICKNINFYGAMRDDQTNSNAYECGSIDDTRTDAKAKANQKNSVNAIDEKSTTAAKQPHFEYEPGLIVKVNFEAPCSDVSDFKAEMKQYSFVRYVDLKEGQSYAYVRVDSARTAPVLIKHCAPNRCQILTGDSEIEYWAKIARDREQKLSKNVKTERKRGHKMRNLLKNIVEINENKADTKPTVTHIRFDD